MGVQFHRSQVWHGFHVFRLGPLIAGLALLPPLLALRAWKWRTLIRTCAPATWAQALRSYLGALPLSLITPGKAGECLRGMYLPYPETHGLRAAGLTVMDNWIDFTAVGWWALPALGALGGPAAFLATLVACLLLSAVPLWLRLVRLLSAALPAPSRVAQAWKHFWPEAASLGWKPALAALAIGVAAYGCEWAQMRCFLSALGAGPAPFLRLAGNLALIQWANSVQITVANLGLREGSTAWLLQKSGWDAHTVLAAAFLQTAASLLLPALIGLFIKPLLPGTKKIPAAAPAAAESVWPATQAE